MMKLGLTSMVLLALAAPGRADSVMLKDGEVIVFHTAHRSGSDFVLTIEVPNPVAGQPASSADITHPMADLLRVEATEPAVLKDAPNLIARGSASTALTQIEPQLNLFASFGEAPGSRWVELAVLKAYALIAVDKDADTSALAAALVKSPNAETAHAGRAIQATLLAKRHEYDKAAALCTALLEQSQNSTTLASASMAMGNCHLAKKEWEPALMCFLEMPVFHPDEKIFGPASELGAARAYFGLQDFERSIDAFSEIIKAHPATPEAKLAQTELPAVKHRRQVVEDSKK